MNLQNYVAFDLEWKVDSGEVFCAAFVDDSGSEEVKHVSELANKEVNLLNWIKQRLLRYPLSMGYYTTGSESDLHVINQRCIANGIPSIVNEDKLVIEPVIGKDHVDLYRVFDKMVVKNYIYKKMYKNMKLESVAQALLGKGKSGKGRDAENMSIEKVKEYCLNDARLTMELSKVGDVDKKSRLAKLDSKLMQLMIALSERLEMPLTHVCHFGFGSMWKKLFKEMGCNETPFQFRPLKADASRKKTGAYVKDPEPGLWENVAVLDVASLYPTIVLKHNISFDTICCECCRNNPKAKVSEEILPGGFWICARREGSAPQKIKQLKAERLEHKRAGRKIMSDGIKILMNALVGLFGNEFFVYADYRAFNLVTGFGRYYILKIIAKAQQLGHRVLYSDTDSIFIIQGAGSIEQIIEEVAKEIEGVELEHEKTYRKLLLTKKKHYIGVKEGETDAVISGMEGEKNNMPKWINETFFQFARDFANDFDPVPLLQASYDMFKEGEVPLEQLKYSIKLSQNPDQYSENHQNRRLGKMANAKAGDVIEYYKVRNGEALAVDSFNQLDLDSYKDSFKTAFDDALKHLGSDIGQIVEGHKQADLFSFWNQSPKLSSPDKDGMKKILCPKCEIPMDEVLNKAQTDYYLRCPKCLVVSDLVITFNKK